MNKTIYWMIGVFVVIAGLLFFIFNPISKDVTVTDANINTVATSSNKYFGNEVTHDFDGDGRLDRAFIVTQDDGGSGIFYYLVAVLNTSNGYVESQTFFLGDRIAPQTTEMSRDPNTPDVIVVNYADRKTGESFAVAPSVGKSVWLLLDPKTMRFGEVVQNFEGEANPSKMTLGMKKWNWVNNSKFTLTFKNNKTFSATTDCNGIGGEYLVNGNKITFTKMMSTLMYCEGSEENNFSKALGQVQSYHFTSKGELVFDLNYDSKYMIFR